MDRPSRRSEKIKKNGHIHNGRQNYQCRECKREFAGTPEKKNIYGGRKELIKKLLPERLSLRGICRAMNVSLAWPLMFFRQITDAVPEETGAVRPEKSGTAVETGEMRSSAGRKKNKKRIRPAADRSGGQTAGPHIGGRTRKDPEKLRKSLPGVYRRCAVCHTGFWEAYEQVIPECRHRAGGKETGRTNRAERTDCTLRHRISGPVRDSLSFPGIPDHHIRAIKFFIRNFNLTKLNRI